MFATSSAPDLPALHYPRWMVITFNITTDFRSDFRNRLYPFLKEASELKQIEHYVFTTESSQYILLFLKTTAYKNTTYIKPELQRLYDSEIISYTEFYLLSFIIPHTHAIAEKLLVPFSAYVTDYLITQQTHQEEDEEHAALSYFLPLYIIFAYAMGMNRIEMAEFYNYTFQHSIQAAFPETAENIVQTIASSFEQQKESLISFVDYIYTSLSENELDEHVMWYNTCKEVHETILGMQAAHHFILPDDFKPNTLLTASEALQERWMLLEKYLCFIDAQLANPFVMQYIIKESLLADKG